MRIAIAGMSLESVSFLPVLTTIEDFRQRETTGAEMLDKYRGSNSVIGGFIAVCERERVEMLPIVMTSGGAAGPAADDALVHYGDRICAGLAALGKIDGVLLDLHGAMATPTRRPTAGASRRCAPRPRSCRRGRCRCRGTSR